MKKKLVLIFNNFEQEHIGKDVFLVPYYLGKLYEMDVSIVYPRMATNKRMPSIIKGVKLHPLSFTNFRGSRHFFVLRVLFYLFRHAKDIDVLMLFHLFPKSVIIALVFKLLNSSGQVYVKMDIPMHIIDKLKFIFLKTSILSLVQTQIYKAFFRKVDLLSCETLDCYNELSNGMFDDLINDKLVLMPNGFDEDERESLGIKIKSYIEKENVIITVGRLGSKQKNTELFLEALSSIDLKDWKVFLIGSMENVFKKYIIEYFIRNPHLKEKVLFTDAVYEKRELFEYYNKSKVFVLTSRWESYGLVLNEAKRFGNYLISTDVGAAKYLIDDGKYGVLIEQDNVEFLSTVLKEIINGDIEINVCQNDDMTETYWSTQVKKIHLM
jgi:glycosyltransferase involved in cell wall biosynthesis